MTGLDRLRARVGNEDALVVAFSGGVDSALLAVVAHQVLGSRMLAVTAVSPSLAAEERKQAKRFAREHGFAHVEVCTDEADRPEYAANDGNRCYHCKSALFDALEPLAAAMGANIALGTNVDDLGDHRPGQRAAAQRGAVAPMVDAELTKEEVREASTALGLSTADKPAAACLASRVAYGDPVTPEVLARVEQAEAAIHELGFPVCRVRAHGQGTVARLEVPAEDIDRAAAHHAELDAAARDAGFDFCALDMAGFSSGRMNVLLELLPTRTAS
ncbi:ATP-dependent sacrificial sulfur transferase LarE [Saccharopolyspora rhizosphaerae]|uniref:ATP-dependent sacrificial sulfur transferase LarE n=1 Tax=Saccharopolyspora rhizosphaerae TaxID=2492662 RepID=UPI001F3466CC|nr:ATP-dependent sacrificial sulfur transferase LarE [Saccharopolyspora rhizosphaerae]